MPFSLVKGYIQKKAYVSPYSILVYESHLSKMYPQKPQHTTQNNNKQAQSLMVSAWYSNSTTAAIARKTFKSLFIKYEYISSGRVDCKISIIWAAFQSLKTKVKAEKPDNKQQLQVAAVRSQVSITEVEKIQY